MGSHSASHRKEGGSVLGSTSRELQAINVMVTITAAKLFDNNLIPWPLYHALIPTHDTC